MLFDFFCTYSGDTKRITFEKYLLPVSLISITDLLEATEHDHDHDHADENSTDENTQTPIDENSEPTIDNNEVTE